MQQAEIDQLKALTQFATVGQLEKLEALIAHGSQRKACAALGISKGSMCDALDKLRKKAAQQLPSLHDYTKKVPDGFRIKGVSQYIGKDGQVAGQWIKSDADAASREAIIRAAIAALTEDVRGLAPITPPPDRVLADLLTVYPFGDPHIGLKVWGKECGADFDLKEAERLTLAAVDRLVSISPASDTAIILPLGDIFHADDQRNVTPGHGHQLDVDSRHVQVLHVGIRTFKRCILRALEKHRRVVVRFVSGNHDPHAVWALAFTIAAFFESEPRVFVDLSPSKHWYFRHGRTLIGTTHGDTVRHEALPGMMAADCPEDWGQTRHRYWLTGHVHTQSVREFAGVTCESFRTLAAADAYAAGKGYRAGRDMRAIVYSVDGGEIERYRADVGLLDPTLNERRKIMSSDSLAMV